LADRPLPGRRPPRSPLPEARAARITRDPWARALGLEFLALAPGACRVALAVKPHMLNALGYPHGGVIFSLADVAFGAACNAHGGPPSVALTMTISFLSAVRPGTRLIAEARERRQGRRAGFYDVTVSTEAGAVVAAVHCVAHRLDPPAARGRGRRPRSK
jgi:acyl-CoA thioesterase